MGTAKDISDANKGFLAPRMEDAIAGDNSFGLDISNPDYITYRNKNLAVELVGGLTDTLPSSLRASIKVYKVGATSPLEIYRSSMVDLFNDNQVTYAVTRASERLRMESGRVRDLLYDFIERLDGYRRNRGKVATPVISIADTVRKGARSALSHDNVLATVENLMIKAGLSDARLGMQLYIASISRITEVPVHCIVNAPRLLAHGLLKEFVPILPSEHLHEMTSMSKHALSYPPTEGYWDHRTLVLHQLDTMGQKGNTLLEYILQGESRRLVTLGDVKTGQYVGQRRDVTSTLNLIGHTNRDHHPMFGSKWALVIPLRDTNAIKDRMYEREVRELAGLWDHEGAKEAVRTLQHIQRELRPLSVHNPVMEQVDITGLFGKDIKTLGLYLRLSNLVALLHQKSGTTYLAKDKNGRKETIEVTPKNMLTALELYREVWLKKDDELQFNVRSTFNALRELLRKRHGNSHLSGTFKLKGVRKGLGRSPATLQRHLNTLELYGMVERCGGNNRTGYGYRVLEWRDDHSKVGAYNALVEELGSLT